MKRRSQPKTGNNPAPYSKYDKRPFVYSAGYYTWRQQYVARNKAEGTKR